MSLPGAGRAVASSAELRAVLAGNWSMFCLRAFPSTEACAAFFGVSGQCARNWMDGDLHAPASAHHLLRAILAFGPDLPAMLAGEAMPAARSDLRPRLRQVA